MGFDDLLYSLGEAVERFAHKAMGTVREIASPGRHEKPPEFGLLRRIVRKNLTPNEFLSLKLQVILLVYLVLSLLVTVFMKSPLYLLILFLGEFLYIRYLILRNWDFFLDPEPYRFFYYWISSIAFLSFMGYLILRRFAPNVYYYYSYLIAVLVAVLVFRHYFKSRYGRDYTYGVVEEVKNDVMRVFVHDDLAANIKPGHYWVPVVPDAEPGRVVKLLLEERTLRGAVPTRVLEVYLDQSSQISTEPKDETE